MKTRNIVANIRTFNTARVFVDRKKAAKRGARKHKAKWALDCSATLVNYYVGRCV